MNALYSGCLTLVVGLVGSLVAPSAQARETAGAPPVAAKVSGRTSAARALSKSRPSPVRKAPRRSHLVPPPSAPSPLSALAPISAMPLLGAVSPRDAAVASVTTMTEGESLAEDSSTTAVTRPALPKAKGNGNKFSMFTDGLLEDMGELPVLGVFILPVTEGVTLPPIEGLASLTFAVKPTKITRGSGFVAIGTFD